MDNRHIPQELRLLAAEELQKAKVCNFLENVKLPSKPLELSQLAIILWQVHSDFGPDTTRFAAMDS